MLGILAGAWKLTELTEVPDTFDTLTPADSVEGDSGSVGALWRNEDEDVSSVADFSTSVSALLFDSGTSSSYTKERLLFNLKTSIYYLRN